MSYILTFIAGYLIGAVAMKFYVKNKDWLDRL